MWYNINVIQERKFKIMIDVNINFTIQDEIYKQYESILQEFLNYLNDLNITNVEVTEN